MSLAAELAIALDPIGARTRLGANRAHPTVSPASLGLVTSAGFWVPPHLELLDRVLVEGVTSGGRLVVAMPPRHGKSELCSRLLPAWFVGTHPECRVMLAAYEAEFAASWGRRARDLLEEHGPRLFGVSVRAASSAANRWDLASHAGGMITAGVGGPITGRGADLLIVDDPVKSVEEAESQTYRERLWDWWRGTALPRLEPGGAVVVIMTRWHQDDFVGRLLADQADQWRVLALPAVAEQDDPLGRAPGEAL